MITFNPFKNSQKTYIPMPKEEIKSNLLTDIQDLEVKSRDIEQYNILRYCKKYIKALQKKYDKL